MIVSFTGTRRGMSAPQLIGLLHTLLVCQTTVLHHGDCVGADAEADLIARCMRLNRVIHPPTRQRLRAFSPTTPNCQVMKPAGYLTRNQQLVEAGELLIAAPWHDTEDERSGTWSTVRYARSLGRKVMLLTRKGHPHAH